MEKPIIATNLDDLLIAHEAFIEPHRVWFDRAILLTKDETLKIWKGKKDYFVGVNKAMEKIMPDATPEERTTQARKWYQEDVIYYIQTHPEAIIQNMSKKLKSFKSKYQLILLTTNTEKYINEILRTANLNGIYDFIVASRINDEPNKEELIKELLRKYGRPKYYLTGKSEEVVIKKFEEIGVKIIKLVNVNQIH